jgi:hypothetical protein
MIWIDLPCVERTYSQENLTEIRLVVGVPSKILQNRKTRPTPYVPQMAVIEQRYLVLQA